jgi:predicted RNA-binding Zn ribbon-like protein
MSERKAFPDDWLAGGSGHRTGAPASDLDLAVLLVNSVDLLEDPADRLTDLTWLRAALRQAGHPDLADHLADSDLPHLRRLRDDMRVVFETADDADAAAGLNDLLARGDARATLVPVDGRLRLVVGANLSGRAALAARLPAAVAEHVAVHGLHRLGVCASDPCRCAFVDRTRAGIRRHCCSWCNDRAAARAYRRRRAQVTG